MPEFYTVLTHCDLKLAMNSDFQSRTSIVLLMAGLLLLLLLLTSSGTTMSYRQNEFFQGLGTTAVELSN